MMIGQTYRKIKTVSHSLAGNQLVSRIAILGTGTALAQLANVIATPLLTYIYSPEDFGIMVIFMGILVIVGSLSSLCYDSAIILPEERNEAASIARLSVIITALISLTSGVFLSLLEYFGYIRIISPWLVLVFAPIGIFTLGLFNISCNWRMRQDDVKALSTANILRTLGALIIQIFVGLAGLVNLGLIVGRLFGQIAATIYVARNIEPLVARKSVFNHTLLIETAKKYAFFPLFRAPQSLLSLATEQIPAFALGFFFGPGPAGLYWLANRVLKLPCTILAEATAKVYYSECARRYRRAQTISPLCVKTVCTLACVAVAPSSLLFMFSPELFELLGDGWSSAGDYGRWLVIWIFFVFCCSPIMITFSVLEKQNILLYIDMFAMLLRLVVILYAAQSESDIIMIAQISIFESLKIIITTFVVFCLCRKADRTPRSAWSHAS